MRASQELDRRQSGPRLVGVMKEKPYVVAITSSYIFEVPVSILNRLSVSVKHYSTDVPWTQ